MLFVPKKEAASAAGLQGQGSRGRVAFAGTGTDACKGVSRGTSFCVRVGCLKTNGTSENSTQEDLRRGDSQLRQDIGRSGPQAPNPGQADEEGARGSVRGGLLARGGVEEALGCPPGLSVPWQDQKLEVSHTV